MTYKATELVYDMYYASERTEDGGKVAKITVQIRDASVGLEKQISTLVRTTPKDKAQPAVYSIGAQTVMDGSDPLLVAIEGHYRASGKDLFETLMGEVTDFIETGIDNTSTWIGAYGMKITSGVTLDNYLPADVLAAGQTA